MKKKIVVFTGAGIDQESGIPTFRDSVDGLWYNYNVDEVATIEGWRNDKAKVLEFHNLLRLQLKDIKPNKAHLAIVKLEEKFDVTVVTQNVSDLHERAGSTNILHLHGELYKSRSTKDPNILYECLDTINIGDKCELGSQLRPHTVLFGEMPYNVDEAYKAIRECDYLIVIGSSLSISYIPMLLRSVRTEAKVWYVDPQPSEMLEFFNFDNLTYIKSKAVKGVTKLVKKLMKDESNKV